MQVLASELTLATHRLGTVPQSPQRQLYLNPLKFVFFSCLGMSCHEEDGDYPINSLFRLAPHVLFALSCVSALYKSHFAKKHVLSASSQPPAL